MPFSKRKIQMLNVKQPGDSSNGDVFSRKSHELPFK